MKAACQGASVIYHAVNVPYPQWQEVLPPVMDNFIATAEAENARLVYVDNLYMYGKVNGPMSESTPVNPCSRKGQLRADLAATLLRAHEKGRVQAVIARGSDFYGPGVLNAGLGEMVLAPALLGKTANAVGDLDMPHTYTYIDDFASAVVTLGMRDEALGKVWHTPNADALSTRQMLDMVYNEAGQSPNYRSAPGILLTGMGLFNPMIRELKEMVYQFEIPFVVDSSEYDRVFGDVANPAPIAGAPGHRPCPHPRSSRHQGASKAVCEALYIPLWCPENEVTAMEKGDMSTQIPDKRDKPNMKIM